MANKITVALAGLGSRGKDTYAKAAKIHPDKIEIVAIADVNPKKVEMVAEEYHIPKERCYTSAEEMLKEEKLADVMFITTQDRQHVAQAIPALKKGYHLLLEKPISPDLDECREIVKVAKECDRKEQQKIYQYLMRRGFKSSDILHVMKIWDEILFLSMRPKM